VQLFYNSRMALWLNRLNAVIFLIIGVWCLVRAQGVATTLGIAFTFPSGLTDFRATYAGMCLAVGIFFAWATFDESWTVPSLYLSVFVYAGLGLTRFAGILSDGSPTLLMKGFFLIEMVLAAAGLWLARR